MTAPPLYRCQKCAHEFPHPSRETSRVPRLFGGGTVTACPKCYREALHTVGMAAPVAATRMAGITNRPSVSAPDTLFLNEACAGAYRVNYYD